MNADGIKAVMSKSVLTVTVPKLAQTRKIDIKAAAWRRPKVHCASGALSNASRYSQGFFSA
jgi:hypothetical protein